MATQTAITYGW